VPRTLIVVQGFVRNQGDAWQWTLDALGRAIDSAIHAALSDEDEADVLAGYLPFAAAIGRRLAEMHALLARESDNPDFDPEPATEADTASWAEAARRQIDAAYAAMEGAGCFR